MTDTEFETTMWDLIEKHRNEELKQFLEQNKVPKKYIDGMYRKKHSKYCDLGLHKTILTTALESANYEAFEYLINCGKFRFVMCHPRMRNYYCSLLKVEATRSNIEKMKQAFLLIHQHKLSPLYYSGSSDQQPIHDAITHYNWPMMKMIIDTEPQTVNALNRMRDTPILTLAYQADHPGLLAYLIGKGAKAFPETYKLNENTPLSEAIKGRRIENVKYLLSIGANPNQEQGYGTNALAVACARYHGKEDDSMIDLLSSVTDDLNKGHFTPLHNAFFDTSDLTLIKRLVKNGADITHEDSSKRNPITYGLAKSFDFIKDMYKEKLLDFSYKNSEGKNYIMLLLEHEIGYPEAACQIICFAAEHGMDFTETDKDGRGLLEYIPRNPNGHIDRGFKKVEQLIKAIIKDQQQTEEEQEDDFSDIGF